jgi:predicted Zn-dependent peptidase
VEAHGAAAFDWHNYGKPTIGARSDIENVPFEHLRAFYRLYYQPDNAVLTIAGRFDADATLRKVARYFGAIPRADARAAEALHGRARAGRHARGDRPARGHRPVRRGACSTCRPARTSTTPRPRRSRRS